MMEVKRRYSRPETCNGCFWFSKELEYCNDMNVFVTANLLSCEHGESEQEVIDDILERGEHVG